MRDFVILSDSTCDLDLETRQKLHVDIINLYIFVDGKELRSSIDWKEYTPSEYYGWVRSGAKISSSQASPNDFYQFFEERIKQGKDILYMGCSSAMSSTVNSALIAKSELENEYPDANIIVIDSLRASLGLGLMVVKAVELKEQGMNINEIAEYTIKHRNFVQQVGTVGSLMYLKRAGRIKSSAAIMGTIVNLKPIITADAHGMNTSIAKTIGLKKAYRRCIDYVKQTIVDSKNQYIYLAHTNCLEMADVIKAMLLEEVECKGIVMGIVSPSMGNSVGPEMFGIYYYGTEVVGEEK